MTPTGRASLDVFQEDDALPMQASSQERMLVSLWVETDIGSVMVDKIGVMDGGADPCSAIQC
ncbi:hypothetical protein D7Z54_12955 [Salibacterium salarium]|uniref:Uncharacterized protein n=1 Tax=Salibacterium salarium TaxID=284579 RepID=A0A428N3A6_9BACI|nr:hypothetical protein [Salibacterium salarium]RSL32930.1 hypothetical protein D7Z54_12955 [Salibacterium salarium]